jgi:hypothetical protein
MVVRGAGKPGQVGGDSPVELIGFLPRTGGNGGEVMLDRAPTVRPPSTGANAAPGSRQLVRRTPTDLV